MAWTVAPRGPAGGVIHSPFWWKPSQMSATGFEVTQATQVISPYGRLLFPHQIINASPCHGMSGGGVFAWSKELPNPHALAQPKLCGIVTGYDPYYNVFIVTRIGHVLSAMLKEFPDLPISTMK